MENNELAKLTEVEQRSLRNEHRIDRLEDQLETIHSLATSVAKMASEQGFMGNEIKEMKEDFKSMNSKLDEITAKPGKRWEKVVELIIAAVVGAIVAFFIHGGVM